MDDMVSTDGYNDGSLEGLLCGGSLGYDGHFKTIDVIENIVNT